MPIADEFEYLLLFSFIFAFLSFISITIWTYLGSLVKTKITDPKIIFSVNVIMAIGLVYVAIDMVKGMF